MAELKLYIRREVSKKWLDALLDNYLGSGYIGMDEYGNKQLNGIGKFYYENVLFGDEYIEFKTEEDMINFILKYG